MLLYSSIGINLVWRYCLKHNPENINIIQKSHSTVHTYNLKVKQWNNFKFPLITNEMFKEKQFQQIQYLYLFDQIACNFICIDLNLINKVFLPNKSSFHDLPCWHMLAWCWVALRTSQPEAELIPLHPKHIESNVWTLGALKIRFVIASGEIKSLFQPNNSGEISYHSWRAAVSFVVINVN